jgi:hypothetical protein
MTLYRRFGGHARVAVHQGADDRALAQGEELGGRRPRPGRPGQVLQQPAQGPGGAGRGRRWRPERGRRAASTCSLSISNGRCGSAASPWRLGSIKHGMLLAKLLLLYPRSGRGRHRR